MHMIQSFRKFFFTLYEQRRLRNWFYTLAFAIFVPTGFRFAILAWEYGDWFDKPLAVLAGLLIGITAAVTLLRIWTVAPRLTVDAKAGSAPEETAAPHASASQIYAAAKLQAAHNRQIARGAAALGPAHRWPFEH
jgi:hypothetical protein